MSFMTLGKVSALALPLIGTGIGMAQAATVVTFERPESYTDASLRSDRGPSRGTLTQIDAYMRKLGDRFLKPGQTLKVTVLDVDLAGEFQPWRSPYDIRFLQPVTWPKIALRYELIEDGQTRLSAAETVSDQNYLMNAAVTNTSDPLRYEKRMLENWFQARFVSGKPPLG